MSRTVRDLEQQLEFTRNELRATQNQIQEASNDQFIYHAATTSRASKQRLNLQSPQIEAIRFHYHRFAYNISRNSHNRVSTSSAYTTTLSTIRPPDEPFLQSLLNACYDFLRCWPIADQQQALGDIHQYLYSQAQESRPTRPQNVTFALLAVASLHAASPNSGHDQMLQYV